MTSIDFVLIALGLVTIACLQLPSVRSNSFWHAMVTPLASIIGSGFLIVAPLLAEIVGAYAPAAMLAIALVALWIGSVIRFNIRWAEPLLDTPERVPTVARVEALSRISLVGAYILSVTFYISLMAAFLLNPIEQKEPYTQEVVATITLVFIGIMGFTRGLKGLETLETLSVSVKIGIILALLVGLFVHNLDIGFEYRPNHTNNYSTYEQIRLLAGMLLIVQGFETSRYLANGYSSSVRIKSMTVAQLVTTGIYLAFVILLLPLLIHLQEGAPDETAIIAISGFAAPALPLMLIVAAIMSQFSAATADTVGAGGIVEEQTRGKVPIAAAYAGVCLFSLTLIWTTDIFTLVSLASRAFALYYFLQTCIAILILLRTKHTANKPLKLAGTGLLALILLFVVLFAIPVEA